MRFWRCGSGVGWWFRRLRFFTTRPDHHRSQKAADDGDEAEGQPLVHGAFHTSTTAWPGSDASRSRERRSSKTRAAAHAALRATTAFGCSGVATATRHVAADDAQELGKPRALAVWAFGLLVAANEQLDFPAALLTGIFVQRHGFVSLSRGIQSTWTRLTPSTSGGR